MSSLAFRWLLAGRYLPVVLLLAGVSACDQSTPVAPTANESSSHPSFGTANRPAEPGHSFVLRQPAGFSLSTVDESQDLVVRHYNVEDIDFCQEGGSPPPTGEEQLVFTQHHVLESLRFGELPVYVYRLSEVPPTNDITPEFCADLLSKWIYRGTHQIRNHDNNLFGFPSPTNSFGWRAEGTVFDRAGQRYHYQESESVVADWGSDPPRIIRDVYQLSIK